MVTKKFIYSAYVKVWSLWHEYMTVTLATPITGFLRIFIEIKKINFEFFDELFLKYRQKVIGCLEWSVI